MKKKIIIKNILKNFFKKNLKINKKIDTNDDLFKKNIVDSFNIIQIILFIEKNFKVKVKNNEVNKINFKSLNNLEKYIIKKKNNENR